MAHWPTLISRATQIGQPIRRLFERYVYLDITSRRDRFHRGGDAIKVLSDGAPCRVAKHENRDLPALQILLITDSFVGRNQQFEARRLGLRKKFAVRDSVPCALDRLCDCMTRQ